MSEKNQSSVNSVQKAAMILVALGAQNAAEVLKSLSEAEVEKITIEIAKMRNISAETLGEIIEEFYQLMLANQYIVQGGLDYAKKVLESAWGTKRRKILSRRLRLRQRSVPFIFYRR
jgi:flagellar motor switch protein FliG